MEGLSNMDYSVASDIAKLNEDSVYKGYYRIPENFMFFSKDKQKLWFKNFKARLKEFNGPFRGIVITKGHLNFLNDDFISLLSDYLPNADLSIDAYKDGFFSAEEMNKIYSLKIKCDKAGNNLVFSDCMQTYDFESVCRSNLYLEAWANQINNMKIDGKNLSPLEKYYMAYNIVTQFKYTATEDLSVSRDLISVLTTGNIVCVGYAHVLSALCAKLGIDCTPQYIAINSNELNHMNCCVKIKDEKYGVDGVYYSDPCMDSVQDRKVSIAHALITYDDLPRIYNDNVKIVLSSVIRTKSQYLTRDKQKMNESQINEELINFLNSNIPDFSKLIDESCSGYSDRRFRTMPSKRDLHKIIDNVVYYCLTDKVREYKAERDSRYSDPGRMKETAKNLIATEILAYTSKGNLEKFKNLLFREMQSYLPEKDSSKFENITYSYFVLKEQERERQTNAQKLNSKSLTLEQLGMLVDNLSRVDNCMPQSYVDRNMNWLLINSIYRAINNWSNPLVGDNVFSTLIRNYCRARIRDRGFTLDNCNNILNELSQLQNPKPYSEFSRVF